MKSSEINKEKKLNSYKKSELINLINKRVNLLTKFSNTELGSMFVDLIKNVQNETENITSENETKFTKEFLLKSCILIYKTEEKIFSLIKDNFSMLVNKAFNSEDGKKSPLDAIMNSGATEERSQELIEENKIIKDATNIDINLDNFENVNSAYLTISDILKNKYQGSSLQKERKGSSNVLKKYLSKDLKFLQKAALIRLNEYNKISNDDLFAKGEDNLIAYADEDTKKKIDDSKKNKTDFIYYALVTKLKLSKNPNDVVFDKKDLENLKFVCDNNKAYQNLISMDFKELKEDSKAIIELQKKMLSINKNDDEYAKKLEDSFSNLYNDDLIRLQAVINNRRLCSKHSKLLTTFLSGTSFYMASFLLISILSGYLTSGQGHTVETQWISAFKSALFGIDGTLTFITSFPFVSSTAAIHLSNANKRNKLKTSLEVNNLGLTLDLFRECKRISDKFKNKGNSNNKNLDKQIELELYSKDNLQKAEAILITYRSSLFRGMRRTPTLKEKEQLLDKIYKSSLIDPFKKSEAKSNKTTEVRNNINDLTPKYLNNKIDKILELFCENNIFSEIYDFAKNNLNEYARQGLLALDGEVDKEYLEMKKSTSKNKEAKKPAKEEKTVIETYSENNNTEDINKTNNNSEDELISMVSEKIDSVKEDFHEGTQKISFLLEYNGKTIQTEITIDRINSKNVDISKVINKNKKELDEHLDFIANKTKLYAQDDSIGEYIPKEKILGDKLKVSTKITTISKDKR